jgi:glycosyltransferase involved in cell wall biosynthesis
VHLSAAAIKLPPELIPLLGTIIFLPLHYVWTYCVFIFAQLCRGVARLAQSPEKKPANLRILVITDYWPPQTHGIALRFQRYVSNLRAAGHEVHVFTTAIAEKDRTSFDHPDLPYIVSPWNPENQLSYTPGLKLAWFLGAQPWDVVHLVFPSTLGFFVLPACVWRGIPTYVSHHVDMDFYMKRYMPTYWVWYVGTTMYALTEKFPALYWASVNASMTSTFLRSHMPKAFEEAAPWPVLSSLVAWFYAFQERQGIKKSRRTMTIPTGIADERFKRQEGDVEDEGLALRKKVGVSPDTTIWLMVQRLAPEKDTDKALKALADLKNKKVHLVIAGDGPAREALEKQAEAGKLPVTFLGNTPNAELPKLYRGADVFVTCSVSETFGLTVLEALACGLPVVLPHCAVFDELWEAKLPSEWWWDANDVPGLLRAIEAASSPTAKRWLTQNPVKASWSDATAELAQQYETMIRDNESWKGKRDWCTHTLEVWLRVLLLAAFLYYICLFYVKPLRYIVVALFFPVYRLMAYSSDSSA